MLISEKVNKIEIDGANRKWFATDNAGILLSHLMEIKKYIILLIKILLY